MINAASVRTTFGIEVEEEIATIFLCPPAPAQDFSCVENLRRALTQAALLDEAQAIIVTGAGADFCACPTGCPACPDMGDDPRIESQFRELAWTILELPLPLVMAINGAATGFGALLALMGDHAVMSKAATLVHPLKDTGSYGSTHVTRFMSTVIGYARAMEALLLGTVITADKAQTWGLVTDLAAPEELRDLSRERALTMARSPYNRRIWRERLIGRPPALP